MYTKRDHYPITISRVSNEDLVEKESLTDCLWHLRVKGHPSLLGRKCRVSEIRCIITMCLQFGFQSAHQ